MHKRMATTSQAGRPLMRAANRFISTLFYSTDYKTQGCRWVMSVRNGRCRSYLKICYQHVRLDPTLVQSEEKWDCWGWMKTNARRSVYVKWQKQQPNTPIVPAHRQMISPQDFCGKWLRTFTNSAHGYFCSLFRARIIIASSLCPKSSWLKA